MIELEMTTAYQLVSEIVAYIIVAGIIICEFRWLRSSIKRKFWRFPRGCICLCIAPLHPQRPKLMKTIVHCSNQSTTAFDQAVASALKRIIVITPSSSKEALKTFDHIDELYWERSDEKESRLALVSGRLWFKAEVDIGGGERNAYPFECFSFEPLNSVNIW